MGVWRRPERRKEKWICVRERSHKVKIKETVKRKRETVNICTLMYILIIGMHFPSLAATACLKPPPTLGWGLENLFYAMVLCRSITRPG